MTRISLSLRAAVVAAILTALGPQAGTAFADRYVSKSGGDILNDCISQADPCHTIQYAVAWANPGETIHIGPGTFEESVNVMEDVTLDGNRAGTLRGLQAPGRTIVSSPIAGKPAIVLNAGGEIRDLRAEGASGSGSTLAPAAIALYAGSAGTVTQATVDGVIAVGGVNNVGVGGPAILASPTERLDVAVRDSGLAHGTNAGAAPLLDLFDARGTVTNVTADPSPSALLLRAIGLDAEADVTALHQVAGTVAGAGVLADSGARVAITRSRVTSHGPAVQIFASGVHTPSTLSATDSAFASIGDGSDLIAAAVQANQGAVGELTLRRSTLLAYGSDVASAVSLESSDADSRASAVAEDSVIRATDPVLPGDADVNAVGEAGGSASFTAARTAFSDVKIYGAATATAPTEAGNVAGDPLLADEAAADLSLRAGSPAIDRGSTGALIPLLDLAGATRSTDGDGDCTAAPDLGAYERPAVTPCTPPGTGDTPSGGTPPAGADTRAPRLTGVLLSPTRLRRATTLRWALDEAATVRIALQRRAGGRWVTRRVISVPGTVGANRRRIARGSGARRLALGRYRVRVVARDAAGNRSAPGVARFRVVRI